MIQMPTSKVRVVLFADVLGFASLMEQHDLDVEAIKISDRPGSWTMDTILASRKNPLTQVFTGFHRSLKASIDLAQMRHPLTAITFSDSAFIATTYLFQAANIAISLVQSLVQQQIPLRVGIAYGTFAAVRFRSDVTDDGGDHAAHFLGTGVVRSHATETCGIKGLRLLLHPSAVSLLSDPTHNPVTSEEDRIRYLECSESEGRNKVGVQYELDWWCLRPTAEASAWHALQDMWDAAPEAAANHYQATAEAIDRMRTGQGEPALSNLKRRTLPRRGAPV